MKALVLGARGAVGTEAVRELRALGHEVTSAGRSVTGGADWVSIDLTAPTRLGALREAAQRHDVVVNASGIEDTRLAQAVGVARLVEISATASYLDALTKAGGSGTVLGAGLVPGLSTVLLRALVDDAPSGQRVRAGDDLDLAIVLGGGETHGSAAVAWTANLAGRTLYQPPESGLVWNFRSRRRFSGQFGRRSYLRADFPDHLLLGESLGASIRSYLATDSRLATAALGAVGRFSSLRGLVSHAPHLGSDGWSLTVQHRQSGRSLGAHGRGQSRTTGVLTAHIAQAAASAPSATTMTAADLLTLSELRGIAGLYFD